MDFELKSALMYACETDQLEVVRLLLKNKAEVDRIDKHGQTCLIQACMNSNVEIAKEILKFNLKIAWADNAGMTAYSYAKTPELIREIFKYIKAMKGLCEADKVQILCDMKTSKLEAATNSPTVRKLLTKKTTMELKYGPPDSHRSSKV
jgi:hypothetical protein